MYFLVASLCCIILHSFGYNLDTELPIIRTGEQDSYFGFSVALHSFYDDIDYKSYFWLLVGAPKGNSTVLKEKGIVNPGVVYRCDFSRDVNCSVLPFDTQGDGDGDRKSNAWFGVSVYSAGHNKDVLACSHRLLHIEGSFYTYPGRCYKSEFLLESSFRKSALKFCEDKNKNKISAGGPSTINYLEHKYCQMGVSISYIEEESMPLIGAPGVYNYQGEIIYYARPQEEVTRNNSDNGYQGYSVTTGKFFKNDKNDIASGAPSFNQHGMVVLFRSLSPGVFHSKPTVIFPPQRQPGTGFGYAVCGVDLNNDGLSDLLVGAPFFSDNTHPEQGRVYVYENRGDGNMKLAYELPGNFSIDKWRANFGRTIAAVGDIDLDGFQDVAIGSPYEGNGEGVVYIYRGSKNGLVATPMQVIKGSTVSSGIKSFGYSISGSLDMDANGYPDILVGAYQSDTVVLLRSKAVMSLSSTVTISPSTFDIKGNPTCNETNDANVKFETLCFLITICTKYTERSGNVSDTIDVMLIMTSDIDYAEPLKRVLFSSNKKEEINRTIGVTPTQKCFDVKAYLREGVGDIFPDIKFKLTYKIVEKPVVTPSSPTDVPSLVPYSVLDPLQMQEVTSVLKFKRDCEKCVPDLELDDSSSKRTLAVGAEVYKLEVTVKNKGDDAYNAKLYVDIPKGISKRQRGVFRVDGDKDEWIGQVKVEEQKLGTNDTKLIIKVANPLKKESEKSLRIELDTSRYSAEPDFLPINISTDSTNEEENATLADNFRFLNISIKSQADLEVNGSTVEEQVSYGGEVVGESAMKRVEDIGNEVIHKYYVKNRGPDPIPSSEIVIHWPFEATSGKHLLYLIDVQFDGKRVDCDFKPGQLNMLGLQTSSAIYGKQQNDTSGDEVKTRRRREADDNQKTPNSKVKREAEPVQDKPQTELDCETRTARCTDIRCTIKFLKADDDVTLTIVSRLWNGTMIEDYQGQLLRVISRATVRSLKTFVVEKNKANNKAKVGTELTPDTNVAAPSKKLPNWVIPVCVVGAVLLLVLIVFCLYKMGFFKRQKYDKNINDPSEMEGMLDNGKA